MNLFLAWNELAETPPAQDKHAARQRMDDCVDALAALVVKVRPRPVLRCQAAIDNIELAEAYSIAQWRVDTDRDRRQLFLSIATTSPVLLRADEGGTTDQYGSSATCDGLDAIGLHAAWLWDGLAVSLLSHQRWNTPSIDINVVEAISETDLDESACVVRHVAHRDHAAAHTEWLQRRVGATVTDAGDLWNRRAELFPHLEFCANVQKRLSKFDSRGAGFFQIVSRLLELERAFSSWDGSPMRPEFLPSKCTPETPQTLREEEDEHTATRDDGSEQLFSWHVRFTPDAGRIFFHGDPDLRVGVIGYIGLKKGRKLT